MSERDIFLALLELPTPADRAAYLDRACGQDPDTRAKVEALLAAHDGAGSFLGVPLVPPRGPEYAATKDFTADTDGEEGGAPADAIRFLAPPARPGSLGRLGHYEILQVLGQGAFGVVFRAFDDILQRVVAVKVLSPQMAATSPARKRFLREARSSAAIRHENVVQVYEVGETPLPYLVMEFIPGETLQQRLDRTGPVEAAEVVRIGRQIAEGLAAAHEQSLIHRDIKPGNILLEGPHLRVKLTDFGLARAADDASISQSGVIAGTPMYMSPEQARGEHLDARSDLFSLGSVLYQMAAGRPPFRATGTLAVLKRVCEDTPRPIREVIPETPRWLCDLITKLHAKDPDRRFQTAREVADVLAACEERLKVQSSATGFPVVRPGAEPQPDPVSGPKPPAARSRSGRKWAAAAALVVCALAAVAVALPQLMKDRTRADRGPADPEPAAPAVDPTAGREALKRAAPRDAVLLMSFDEDTFDRPGDRVRVRDLSGRGHHAAGDRMGHTPDGKVGGGLRCDGGSLALARSLIALQPEYTITAWCRLDPANRGDDFRILRTSGSSGADFPIYRFEIAADRSCLVHAWNKDRAKPRDPEQWVPVATPPDAVPDGWVFVAVTLARGGRDTGAMRIVVGDKVVHRKSQVVGPEADAADYIGWKNAGGLIDELAVFHRALSDDEIAALRELGRNNISLAELVAPPQVEPKTSPPTPASYTGVPPKAIRGSDTCIAYQYSPDGKWLVTRDYTNPNIGAIRVWEVATGEVRATFADAFSQDRGVAFSPDGKLLASTERDGGRLSVVVRNVGLFDVVKRLPCDANNVEGLAFDRTGTVVAACADKDVILWTARTGEEVARVTGDFHQPLTIAFSPTADLLALQDGRGAANRNERWEHDSRVLLYDLDPKSPTYKQRLHTWDTPDDGFARELRFSADGANVLFCRGEQGLIRVAAHDAKTGAKVRELVPQQDRTHITIGTISPDGKRLVLRHGKDGAHVGVWNLDTGDRAGGFDLPGVPHRAFAVDPTFRTACIGFHTGSEAKFYDLATGREVASGQPLAAAEAPPGWAALTPAEAKAENGTTLTAQPGGAVLASGKHPDTDTYVLTFAAPPARLAALRLEALPHDSLPNKGPGRHPHPQMPFVLTTVRAALSDPGAAGGWCEIKLARAWADHNSGDDATPPLVLDADDNTGWGAETGKPHFLVVEPDGPLAVPAGARLRVTLEFKHRDAHRQLGHFRLSAAAVRPLEPLAEAEVKRIAALPPLEQVEAVREELKRRNPGFDGTVTPTIDFESGAVVGLKLSTRHVADLSPVRALVKLRKLDAQGAGGNRHGLLADLSPLRGLPLTELSVSVNAFSDLSPLQGMPLTDLHVDNSSVTDLSPLKGMPLRTLNCSYTLISDLSPLKGLPLRTIWTNNTKVADLAPLKDAPLEWVTFQNTKVTDTSVLKGKKLSQVYLDFEPRRDAALLRGIPTLERINDKPAAEFLKEFGEPPAGAGGPFADADARRIAALPAADQIEEVRKELKRRNPWFDGTLVPTIADGAVTALEFSTEYVTDLSPVRGLPQLRTLRVNGPAPGAGLLADLSPLAGLALTELMVQNNRVADLAPVRKLPLVRLWIDANPVSDLTPLREPPLRTLGMNRVPVRNLEALRGLKLERLSLNDLAVTDLAPLQGQPLRWLTLIETPVEDLSPLKGMPLEYLNLQRTKVRDLGPLTGLPLAQLLVPDTAVTDLSPLKGTPLVKLWCDFQADRDGPVLRAIPTLKEINGRETADVLKGGPEPFADADATRVAALPAADQIEEVRKELRKRNPGFDGTLVPTIEEGVVVGLEFCTDEVTDVGPVRALAGLKRLTCRGTERKGKLVDLSPLKGLRLTALDANNNVKLVDLSPLKGSPLKELYVQHTGVSDLAPLKGLPLENVNASHTGVADLAPFAGMPLHTLYLDNTSVTDLTPLKGVPLKHLNLRGLKLDLARDHAVVRELPALEDVNGESVVDFLKAPPPG